MNPHDTNFIDALRRCRKPIKNILRNPGDNMTTNMLNAFMDADAHDAFAQSMGYADAAQMEYYEEMAIAEEDARRTQEADLTESYNAPHELDKVDSREVYVDNDIVEMYPELYGEDDMAGVY